MDDVSFDLPPGFVDAVYVETTIQMDWRDRLKAALGWSLVVWTRTLCESRPGNTQTDQVRVYLYDRKRRGRLEVGVAETLIMVRPTKKA